MTSPDQIVASEREAAQAHRHAGSDMWKYGCFHDVVPAHGRIFEFFSPRRLQKAAAILADQLALAYVEGLALLPGTPGARPGPAK